MCLAVTSLITLVALPPTSSSWAESSMACAALMGALVVLWAIATTHDATARQGRMRGRPG